IDGGTASGATSGLTIGGSNTESGTITLGNGGSIRATAGDALHIVGSNAGEIENGGAITAGSNGIAVDGDNGGLILNEVSGTITAGQDGIHVGGGHVIFGKIQNRGQITAAGAGIHLSGNNFGGFLPNAYISSHVLNSGNIAADGTGIYVGGSNADRIFNLETGVIGSTTADGIHIGGDNNAYSSLIENAGSIGTAMNAVGDDGIEVAGANEGTVTNLSTGSIYAEGNGIVVGSNVAGLTTRVDGQLIGAAGIISNAGQITAISGDGILVGTTNLGVVDNRATGTITATAGNGIQVIGANAAQDGEVGEIYNSGTITAIDGIHVGGTNAGFIENTGTIAATDRGIHVALDNAGEVLNAGRVTANAYGIRIDGANTGSIESAGSEETAAQITAGTQGLSVGSDNLGSITNGLNSTITAGIYGILVQGDNAATGTLSNAGTITGTGEWTSGMGVHGSNAGAVTNSGSVRVGGTGLFVDSGNAATGLIENSGSIVSGSDDGINVYAANAGTIHNTATGVIEVQDTGIAVYGANVAGASILNAGRLATEYGDGLYVRGTNEGSIVNTGTIDAGGSGIEVRGRIDGGMVTGRVATPVGDDTPVVPVPANNAAITNNGTITAAEDGIRVTGPSVPIYDFAVAGVAPELPAPIDLPPTNGTDGVITNAGSIVAGYSGINVGSGSVLMKMPYPPSGPTVANAGLVQNLAGASITAEE
ncbi:MAG TPA: hypothetical protein PK322_09980, partial [Opitutaceae bacterium]|nr:hypothetical protein [Opitutaceae bacterium]